jgi:hypothetical protein
MASSVTDIKKEEGVVQTHTFSFNRLLLKIKYSFYSTLVFFIFANPESIRLIQSFVGGWFTFASPQGVPTVFGLFGMGFLFFWTMLAFMLLPSE